MKKIALITGITGQDGSYLAEFLLDKGYYVHGIIRRSSSFNTSRIDHIYNNPNLKLHYGDVSDSLSIDQIMQQVKPDEIYHLGAQSHVRVSFDVPAYTAQVDAFGTLNMLEAMRKHCPTAKLYNAATSELFGEVLETPQKETTPFNPRSPYGVAKIYAYYIVKNYRESYNLFAVNGILFNHESERRGSTFVTKKITEGLVQYEKDGTCFYLGNIYAKRDWGYAKEFVTCMWLMLQQEQPEDFVIGTGETYTIKEFINECLIYLFKPGDIFEIPEEGIFRYLWRLDNNITLQNLKDNENLIKPIQFIINFRFEWKKDGKGREILWDKLKESLVIGIDEKYYRPAEVNLLLADASKAKQKLGWEPKIKFKELVEIMMNNEIKNM